MGSIKTVLRCGFAAFFFFSQSVFVYAAQTTFWAERQKKLQVASLSLPFSGLSRSLIGESPKPALPGLLQRTLLNRIPSSLGRVSFRSPGVPAALKNGTPVVLHVQDIHASKEAQKNISALIRRLDRDGLVAGVAVEGTSGRIDLSNYQTFPVKKSMERVSDFLLSESLISGAVHGLMTSSARPPIVGMERADLYRANVEAFKKAVPLRAKTDDLLKRARRTLNERKKRIFSPRLLSFDDRVDAFHDGRLSIGDFIRFLNKNASSPSPELSSFLEALDVEKKLDFERLKKEWTRFQTNPSRTIPPDVADYLTYDRLVRNLDGRRLFDEIQNQQEKRYRELTRSKEEMDLVRASRAFRLTDKLIHFQLTPSEWMIYRRERTALPALDLTPFEEFYVIAAQRDRAMAENLRRFYEENPPSAFGTSKFFVLVTGGFHSSGLGDLLSEADIPRVEFIPFVSNVEKIDKTAYLNQFLREKTPLEKLFEGERLFMAPNPAQPFGLKDIGPLQTVADYLANPDWTRFSLDELKQWLRRAKNGWTLDGYSRSARQVRFSGRTARDRRYTVTETPRAGALDYPDVSIEKPADRSYNLPGNLFPEKWDFLNWPTRIVLLPYVVAHELGHLFEGVIAKRPEINDLEPKDLVTHMPWETQGFPALWGFMASIGFLLFLLGFQSLGLLHADLSFFRHLPWDRSLDWFFSWFVWSSIIGLGLEVAILPVALWTGSKRSDLLQFWADDSFRRRVKTVFMSLTYVNPWPTPSHPYFEPDPAWKYKGMFRPQVVKALKLLKNLRPRPGIVHIVDEFPKLPSNPLYYLTDLIAWTTEGLIYIHSSYLLMVAENKRIGKETYVLNQKPVSTRFLRAVLAAGTAFQSWVDHPTTLEKEDIIIKMGYARREFLKANDLTPRQLIEKYERIFTAEPEAVDIAIREAATYFGLSKKETRLLLMPDWVQRVEIKIPVSDESRRMSNRGWIKIDGVINRIDPADTDNGLSGNGIRTMVGWLTLHNRTRGGPIKGGVRLNDDVTKNAVVKLGGEMTVKTLLAGIPYGGGKAGIRSDQSPREMDETTYALMVRGFFGPLTDLDLIGPWFYVPAPDVNTNEDVMAVGLDELIFRTAANDQIDWTIGRVHQAETNFSRIVFDRLSRSVGSKSDLAVLDAYIAAKNDGDVRGDLLAAFTGKSMDKHKGIQGRNEATGRGLFFVIKAAVQKFFDNANSERSLEGLRVAIQGFGSVGYYLAKVLRENGAVIVALSDVNGVLYWDSENKRSLEPDEIKDYSLKNGNSLENFSLNGARFVKEPGVNALFAEEADIIIPAAMQHAINKGNFDRIGPHVKLVVEGANGAITPDADELIQERRPDIRVLPDILANAGGVTVSYYEWQKNLGMLPDTIRLPQVQRRLRRVLTPTTLEVIRKADVWGVSLRQAAYRIAIGRLLWRWRPHKALWGAIKYQTRRVKKGIGSLWNRRMSRPPNSQNPTGLQNSLKEFPPGITHFIGAQWKAGTWRNVLARLFFMMTLVTPTHELGHYVLSKLDRQKPVMKPSWLFYSGKVKGIYGFPLIGGYAFNALAVIGFLTAGQLIRTGFLPPFLLGLAVIHFLAVLSEVSSPDGDFQLFLRDLRTQKEWKAVQNKIQDKWNIHIRFNEEVRRRFPADRFSISLIDDPKDLPSKEVSGILKITEKNDRGRERIYWLRNNNRGLTHAAALYASRKQLGPDILYAGKKLLIEEAFPAGANVALRGGTFTSYDAIQFGKAMADAFFQMIEDQKFLLAPAKKPLSVFYLNGSERNEGGVRFLRWNRSFNKKEHFSNFENLFNLLKEFAGIIRFDLISHFDSPRELRGRNSSLAWKQFVVRLGELRREAGKEPLNDSIDSLLNHLINRLTSKEGEEGSRWEAFFREAARVTLPEIIKETLEREDDDGDRLYDVELGPGRSVKLGVHGKIEGLTADMTNAVVRDLYENGPLDEDIQMPFNDVISALDRFIVSDGKSFEPFFGTDDLGKIHRRLKNSLWNYSMIKEAEEIREELTFVLRDIFGQETERKFASFVDMFLSYLRRSNVPRIEIRSIYLAESPSRKDGIVFGVYASGKDDPLQIYRLKRVNQEDDGEEIRRSRLASHLEIGPRVIYDSEEDKVIIEEWLDIQRRISEIEPEEFLESRQATEAAAVNVAQGIYRLLNLNEADRLNHGRKRLAKRMFLMGSKNGYAFKVMNWAAVDKPVSVPDVVETVEKEIEKFGDDFIKVFRQALLYFAGQNGSLSGELRKAFVRPVPRPARLQTVNSPGLIFALTPAPVFPVLVVAAFVYLWVRIRFSSQLTPSPFWPDGPAPAGLSEFAESTLVHGRMRLNALRGVQRRHPRRRVSRSDVWFNAADNEVQIIEVRTKKDLKRLHRQAVRLQTALNRKTSTRKAIVVALAGFSSDQTAALESAIQASPLLASLTRRDALAVVKPTAVEGLVEVNDGLRLINATRLIRFVANEFPAEFGWLGLKRMARQTRFSILARTPYWTFEDDPFYARKQFLIEILNAWVGVTMNAETFDGLMDEARLAALAA